MVEFVHPLPYRRLVNSRVDELRDLVAGKSVLHVGCVDSGLTGLRLETGSLLHARLGEVATRIVGVDVDERGLEMLREHGIEDLHAAKPDGSSPLDEHFDVVVAGEVLEHVSAPGSFIDSYLPNLKPDGHLVLTVPNAYSLIGVVRLLGGSEICHEDHVAYYSFVTLRRILERSNLVIESLSFYSELGRLSGVKRLAKVVYNGALSLVAPQYGEGIIVSARRA